MIVTSVPSETMVRIYRAIRHGRPEDLKVDWETDIMTDVVRIGSNILFLNWHSKINRKIQTHA